MSRFTEPQMRPPQEAHSLLLRATQGCTYNKCSFCYVSRGYPFRAVTDTELSLEAERARPFFSPDTPIYLTGSNPLALPFARLASWIAVLRTSFPRFSRLSMQARIGDIALKSDGELSMLARLGLNHLYIGTENGNNMVLSLMNKGHTAEDIVRELTRLDEAGITYTNFYILGMGGKGRGIESGLATARMFNMSSAELGAASQPGGELFGIEVTNGGLVIFGGGELLKDKNGVIVGAIGVSGGSVQEDTNVAKAGVAALNK